MPDTLELLLKFSEDLGLENPRTEDALWEYLVRKGAGLLCCHAASFFEADEIKRTLTFKKSLGPVGGDLVGLSFGYQGIVGACAETRKSILINDTETSPFFTKKVDKGSGFKTKNVIAVPVLANGALLGVVEFINSMDGAFTEEQFKSAPLLAALIGRDVCIRRLEAAVPPPLNS
ncbi:MAG: GAF domain-containing protein [Elusimicrobia bacterium]|nr:GAF domain-containing protein [Elusimicrobiota bacterium]